MSRMKSLLTTALWRAVMDLSDGASAVFLTPARGERAAAFDRMMAEVLRAVTNVLLGLEGGGRMGHLEAARSALAGLAVRIHLADAKGIVRPEEALMVRGKIRRVVDEVDMERYRIRRRAG